MALVLQDENPDEGSNEIRKNRKLLRKCPYFEKDFEYFFYRFNVENQRGVLTHSWIYLLAQNL